MLLLNDKLVSCIYLLTRFLFAAPNYNVSHLVADTPISSTSESSALDRAYFMACIIVEHPINDFIQLFVSIPRFLLTPVFRPIISSWPPRFHTAPLTETLHPCILVYQILKMKSKKTSVHSLVLTEIH